MNRSLVPQYIGVQHVVSPLSPNDISLEILSCAEEVETLVASPKQPREFRRTDFNPDWHDAKEIVVPFDESSFSGILVDEKTFQAAYSRNRLPPKVDNQRLESVRTIGKVAITLDRRGDFLAFCRALLVFVEILLLVWTSALLLSGFPISKWLSCTLVSLWSITLIIFKFVLAKPMSYRLFLWCGTFVTTAFWLVWSPGSHEFIIRLPAYLFLT